MAPDEDHWQQLIDGLRAGDRNIVTDFCRRYGGALHRIADRRMPDALRRRVGPEDVVQSACRTFLRRANVGEFQLADTESLWQLLCAITLTKIREQTRFHLRQKRGLDREAAPLPTGNDSVLNLHPTDSEPTPAEAAEFADQFQQLIGQLDEEEQQVVDLKLQECTNEQVAERMGTSERTVRRIIKRVQTKLARTFEVA